MTREIVWRPDRRTVAESNLKAFMDAVGVADYDALNDWSVREPDAFWTATIEHLGIRWVRPYERIRDLSDGPAWAKWCVGGTTNLALNCLDKYRDTAAAERTAIVWESETGRTRTWSYRHLDAESCRLALGLRELGIGKGDPVGIYMPMLPEVAAAFFACARLGAIVVPLFSGFGAGAIATRLNDAEAKAVITVDATRRRGDVVPMQAVLNTALHDVPSVRHVVVLHDIGEAASAPVAGRDHSWSALVDRRHGRMESLPVEAEHPLLLVYTSGTTGRPKGTVLTHIGVMTKMGLDICINMDFKPADRLLWMSDFGWVVGPMTTVTAAFSGGVLVMAEGAPDHPEPGRMWRLIQDHEVSYLGIAPTAVRTLMRYGAAEVAKHDVSSLRLAASTGEPWTDEAWLWLFDNVLRRRAPILNWSGGTEVGGGIISGTLLHPAKPCAFAGPIPGSGADILDEAGNSVGPGEVGELVMRVPSIGMTKGIWRDPERYLETYWSTYPGIWRHGDWASRDEDGLWYVHGRSDDTIKVAGKRTGPAEIEGLVMATGKVSEAAAIGVADPVSGQAVMCVCLPANGVRVDDALRAEVAEAVAAGLGRPFRPKRLLFVNDLPKTRNMKVMRRVVRAVVEGRPPGDLTALVNPEAVDELRQALAADAA